jgi:hypothetical protein
MCGVYALYVVDEKYLFHSITRGVSSDLVAVIITVFMPEFEKLTDIRGRMHYFFTDACQIDGPEECTGHQIK